jgi:hypothetical protein
MVSPEGIDLNGEAEGWSGQADAVRGEANERSELVTLNFTSWNRIADWLRRLHALNAAA